MIDTFFILFTTIACLLIAGRAIIMDTRVPWFTTESTAAEVALPAPLPLQPGVRAGRKVALDSRVHALAGASRDLKGGPPRSRGWRSRALDGSPSPHPPG